MWGNLTNSSVLSAKNGKLSNKSGYSRLTPVAHKAVSYGGEAGLKIKGFFNNCPKFPDIIPFVRYEYYNSQESVVAPYNADDRLKVGMFTTGINWRPLPCLVIKGDYTTRRIGSGKYNSENEFGIGIAYIGNLLPGTYYLVETAAPPGYKGTERDIIVTVSASGVTVLQAENAATENVYTDGNMVTIVVTNSTGTELPHTGGPGTFLFTSGGLFLMAAAMIYLICVRRRERRIE